MFVRWREGTSSTLMRTHQRQSAFTTTQVSPTTHQNTHIRHHSLVKIAGQSISLPCSSSNEANFFWSYCPLGSNKSSILYNGGKMIPFNSLIGRTTVSKCDARKCTFHVTGVQLNDTGSFTCRRYDGFTYWSLTVLGKYCKAKHTLKLVNFRFYHCVLKTECCYFITS